MLSTQDDHNVWQLSRAGTVIMSMPEDVAALLAEKHPIDIYFFAELVAEDCHFD